MSDSGAPLATYEAYYLNRGAALLLLPIVALAFIGMVIVIVMNEAALNEIPYSTGPRVLAMLLGFAAMIVVPLLGPATRRTWSLFADRVEIRQRPVIPFIGFSRSARIPFGEIAAARLGSMLSGMSHFEIQTKAGARYRIAPRTIGKGKEGRIDEEGLHAFIDRLRDAIRTAGLPLPPGEVLRTATSGIGGIIILSVLCLFMLALCGMGVWMTVEGEAGGLRALAFGIPLVILLSGLILTNWRRWRAGR